MSSIEYWHGVMQSSNSQPPYRWFNKVSNYKDHTNYRWRLSNPYSSLLDNIYVEVPFSRVSVTTGENPILISGANDPYKESFVRPIPNKTEEAKPVEPVPFTWGSLIGGKYGRYLDAGINVAKFTYQHG